MSLKKRATFIPEIKPEAHSVLASNFFFSPFERKIELKPLFIFQSKLKPNQTKKQLQQTSLLLNSTLYYKSKIKETKFKLNENN